MDRSGDERGVEDEFDHEPDDKLPYPLSQRPEYSREDFDVNVKNRSWLVLSPLDSHPESMDAKTAYQIVQNSERIVSGSGRFTARQLVIPPFQLRDDLERHADTEMFLRVLTRINDVKYPGVTFYGFAVIPNAGYTIPSLVQEKVYRLYEGADVRFVSEDLLCILADAGFFPDNAPELLDPRDRFSTETIAPNRDITG